MKHSAIISSLAILIASLPLAGCLSYDDTPTTNWNAHSQAGIPVKTRLKGQGVGFSFHPDGLDGSLTHLGAGKRASVQQIHPFLTQALLQEQGEQLGAALAQEMRRKYQ